MNKNKQLIQIEIPDETTKKMLKDKWVNNAVWAITDVIIWMQEDIKKWLNRNNENKK